MNNMSYEARLAYAEYYYLGCFL